MRLAEDAVFLALATRLTLFTLHANNAAGSGLGGHGFSVEGGGGARNITEVMKAASSLQLRAKAQRLRASGHGQDLRVQTRESKPINATLRSPFFTLATRDSELAAVLP